MDNVLEDDLFTVAEVAQHFRVSVDFVHDRFEDTEGNFWPHYRLGPRKFALSEAHIKAIKAQSERTNKQIKDAEIRQAAKNAAALLNR